MDSPKYFLDIIQMIALLKDEINYEDLVNDAKAHQTLKRIVRTISIVYQEYPFLYELKNSPQWKRKQYVLKMDSANDKTNRFYRYVDFVDYQFFSYDSFIHSLIEILHWLFPSKSDLFVQINAEMKKSSYFISLFYLYKQRLRGIVKAMVSTL